MRDALLRAGDAEEQLDHRVEERRTTRAGIGIGGNSSITRLFGKYMPYASSRPNTPPDAPTVG